MNYLFFVNGHYWDCTRSGEQAFRWFREFKEMGHSPGLRFVHDGDEEVIQWLVPEEARQALEAA